MCIRFTITVRESRFLLEEHITGNLTSPFEIQFSVFCLLEIVVLYGNGMHKQHNIAVQPEQPFLSRSQLTVTELPLPTQTTLFCLHSAFNTKTCLAFFNLTALPGCLGGGIN